MPKAKAASNPANERGRNRGCQQQVLKTSAYTNITHRFNFPGPPFHPDPSSITHDSGAFLEFGRLQTAGTVSPNSGEIVQSMSRFRLGERSRRGEEDGC